MNTHAVSYGYGSFSFVMAFPSLAKAMEFAKAISPIKMYTNILVCEILCEYENGKYITKNRPCVSTNELSEMGKASGS